MHAELQPSRRTLATLAESAGMDGYWGTPTATADFCEPNYAHTRYIAEFLNALSSVPIVKRWKGAQVFPK